MEELTIEQKEQLNTWASQRDLLLSEISAIQVTKDRLEIDVKNLSNSYTDIEKRLNEIVGRISELNKKESELILLVSTEVAELKSQKSVLEAEIPLIRKVIEELTVQKSSLESDVSSILVTFNTIKGEALLLDKVIERVTKFSEGNTNEINTLVENLKTSLKSLTDINEENVIKTNQVLNKLPEMLLELKRTNLIKNKT